jgi:hypothetical protein
MFNQLFLVLQHVTTDHHAKMFESVLPTALLVQGVTRDSLFAYFKRAFLRNQNYIQEKIKEYGNMWLQKTEAGQAWRAQISTINTEQNQKGTVGTLSLHFQCPNTPADLLM